MLPGDIMGHEMMGEVVEVGSGVDGHLKKGDRIVIPFTIIWGSAISASVETSPSVRPPIATSISR